MLAREPVGEAFRLPFVASFITSTVTFGNDFGRGDPSPTKFDAVFCKCIDFLKEKYTT